MELLDGRPVWSMSGGEALTELDLVDDVVARLATRRLQLVARVDETGHAEEIGAHDTARLLSFRYRLDSVEAHRDVRLARALAKYPAVSDALPDTTAPFPGAEPTDTTTDAAQAAADDDGVADDVSGDAGMQPVRPLCPAQAQAIVWALERVAARVPPEHLAVAEEQLVGLARHLSPGQLRKAGKEIGDLLDSDGPGPDEDKAYARESLTLANAENGVKFRGFLANENAELLRGLVHAGARPHKTIDGELDPRPRDKRQADALTTALTIAATATDTGHTPPTTRTNPGEATAATDPTCAATGATRSSAKTTLDGPITDTAGADTASAAPDAAATATDPAAASGDTAGTAGVGGTAGPGGGWVPGFGAKANITVTIDFNDLKAATADATGQLVYGDALSAAAIRRLACDATIIPLVLGSNSEPLDVGRSERLVNRAMRRALNARDKGCVVCGAPPIQCDAHHVQSWIDGGPTAISNLVLLCRRHHIDLHHGHWTITITNDTVHVSRPTWADPPPITRRHAQTHPPTQTPVAGDQAPIDIDVGPPPLSGTPAEPETSSAAVRSALGSMPGALARDGSPAESDAADCAPSSPPPNGTPTRAVPTGVADPRPPTGRAGERDPWDDPASSPWRGFRPAQSDGETGSCADNADGVSAVANARLDPWGESEILAEAPRRNRWANEGTREEAARFAVWGDTARKGEPIGASPPPAS
ncbi:MULTISPECIES: DUF222 domain-containing protein [unclassified Kribbella]|uniref:DUF222 domain-containing protein n=1 Tax=unclassified Kribbella TaxID=2644121 RepID=UPI003017F6E4